MDLVEKIESILEVFKTPTILHTKISMRGGEVFFKVGDKNYVTEFSPMLELPKHQAYDVSFALIQGDDLENSARTTSITGTGDSFKVFAGVIDSIKDFAKKYRPEIIHFMTHGRSRVKLYDALYDKFSGSSGYKKLGKTKNPAVVEYWIARKDFDINKPQNEEVKELIGDNR